jgi:hypothetical protein
LALMVGIFCRADGVYCINILPLHKEAEGHRIFTSGRKSFCNMNVGYVGYVGETTDGNW